MADKPARNGKGDADRTVDRERFARNHERIYRRDPLKEHVEDEGLPDTSPEGGGSIRASC